MVVNKQRDGKKGMGGVSVVSTPPTLIGTFTSLVANWVAKASLSHRSSGIQLTRSWWVLPMLWAICI